MTLPAAQHSGTQDLICFPFPSFLWSAGKHLTEALALARPSQPAARRGCRQKLDPSSLPPAGQALRSLALRAKAHVACIGSSRQHQQQMPWLFPSLGATDMSDRNKASLRAAAVAEALSNLPEPDHHWGPLLCRHQGLDGSAGDWLGRS
ncbi:hypothetical protein HaLaN_20365 [Haematococcus lacustris]|uniref:Uncharacterized protein n=1 Tax=Haematococcus lacustris TaxID=44745 RepID=A0A699ZJM6_HAELA|nr:hypothetical protein HaLaN_20365 [Haematococcus lacustris]